MKLNIKPKCLLVYYFAATFSCPLHINIDCLYFGSCYQLNLTKNNVLYKINISYAFISKYKFLGTCSTVIDIIFHCGFPLTYDFSIFRCEVVDNDYYYGDPPLTYDFSIFSCDVVDSSIYYGDASLLLFFYF